MATESSNSEIPVAPVEAEEQPSTSITAAPGSSTDATSSTSVSFKDKQDAIKQALNHLVQGKRHLLIKDIPSAIISLGESCQLLTETNGPLCADNAEAHFYYGKALLEQSRLDLAVFDGGQSAGKTSSEDEKESGAEEDENEESAEEDEADENEAEAEPQQSEDCEAAMELNEESTATEKVDEKKDEDLNAPSPATVADSEKPSTSTGISASTVNGEKEGEEELSNLELAWEVLEVAKIGYSVQLKNVNDQLGETKTDDEEGKKTLQKSQIHLQKRLAETHSLLGEVATESENYPQAVDEFKTGIKVLSQFESPDSREIAQYYFQMGMAYSYGKSFQDAIESFKKSKDIIEQRIANLALKIENKQTDKDLAIKQDDPNYTSEDVEIEELRELIPELDEKVVDTIDAEREHKATLEEETKEREIILKNSPVKNPNPPMANDISHLVKKKKKADDLPIETPPAKRLCSEVEKPVESEPKRDEVSSSSNGHSNGSLEINP